MDDLLKCATEDVSFCVDTVIGMLSSSADEKNWEFMWFVDEFRKQFNHRVWEIENG